MSSPRTGRVLGWLKKIALWLVDAETQAEREANATDDASQPLVNEDFSFRITAPSSDWKLLHEHDASGLEPRAIAGAINASTNTFGVVFVERAPGATLEQVSALLWQQPLPEQVIESEQDIQFEGLPAKRRVFSAKTQGQLCLHVHTVFLHQDHVYQLQSWSAPAPNHSSHLEFHEAFDLLDGEVRGRRELHEPVTHFDRVGWRIRDGRYESALTGMRLRLPASWRFIVGAERDRMQRADSEIVATNDTGVFVSLTLERVDKPTAAALAEWMHSQPVAGTPIGEPITQTIAGQQVELRRLQLAPLEIIHGVHFGEEASVSIYGWYVERLRDEALPSIESVLAELETIPVSEGAALREQLLDTPNHERHFSTNRAFRAGEFVDFEHQLRWQMPRGFWSIKDFDTAQQRSPETVLLGTELELGVHVAIEAWTSSSSDPAAMLDILLEGKQVLSRGTTVIDGLTIHRARWSELSQPASSDAVAVTRRGQQMITIQSWARVESAQIEAAITAAIEALDYTPELERTRIEGRTYTDRVHGFSFDLPAHFDVEPRVTDLGGGLITIWKKGKQELVACAISGASNDEQWITGFSEQLLRDVLGKTAKLDQPERSEGTLGGLTARQLTYEVSGEDLHAQIAFRDPLLHCMLYRNLDEVQRQQVEASWTLLD